MAGRRGQPGKVRLREVARLRADGLTCAEIGRRYGLSARQVC
jgi:DNA-binding CsgD family transcriptional regulator